jgi:hypothetical protein
MSSALDTPLTCPGPAAPHTSHRPFGVTGLPLSVFGPGTGYLSVGAETEAMT